MSDQHEEDRIDVWIREKSHELLATSFDQYNFISTRTSIETRDMNMNVCVSLILIIRKVDKNEGTICSIECISIGKHQVVTNPELVFKPISENLYHENTQVHRLEAIATLSHHTYTVHEKRKCKEKCIRDSLDNSGQTMCINAATSVECDKYNCSVTMYEIVEIED